MTDFIPTALTITFTLAASYGIGELIGYMFPNVAKAIFPNDT